MFTRRISVVILSVLTCAFVQAQEPAVYDISDHMGKVRLNIETSAMRYRAAESVSYMGFGFGAGGEGEVYRFDKGKSSLHLAATLGYNQTSESQKTYSVENNNYYYRSTTLTGRLLLSPAILYKQKFGKQLQIGAGFQPQFVLATFKDYYQYGISASAIPDVRFRKTEVSLLASLSYIISPLYSVNVVAQVGVSPITQSSQSVFADGLRMQISRRIW